jgi:hypothetical protein
MRRTRKGQRLRVRGGRCRPWLLLVLCYLTTSCIMSPHGRQFGMQEWNPDRGPVVPHDTFPSNCSLCHEGGGWENIRADFQFDHARETGFALSGAHQDAQCLRCHNDRGPVVVFSRRGCAGCHEDVHRRQLGAQCSQCHHESNWVPEGQVVLHNRTRFPLVGVHTAVACFRCHPGAQVGNFSRAPVRCEACHQQDLARARSPDHAAQGWTQDCDQCHKPITWAGAGFIHSRFPLSGAHATASCSACHGIGIFTGLSHACASCHLPDYQSANNPDHVAGNFSTNCESCHNTASWQGARFDHAGITSNCVQCHLPAYHATTAPNHLAAGYPTSCETCHDTDSWQGAVFNHTFRITSGPHKSYNCAECHQVPTNYRIVSCTHCHEHRQSEADDKHKDVSGYSWNSGACIGCHPSGRE